MTREEFHVRLSSLRSRGEIKRFAKEIAGIPQALNYLHEYTQLKGLNLEGMPIKKQLRVLLDRAAHAQERKNPIFVDESFLCGHCGQEVPLGGVKIRDHCPFCLWGKHLDNVPGDRAAECSGLMQPISLESRSGKVWIHYTCTQCTHRFRVVSHPDDKLEVL